MEDLFEFPSVSEKRGSMAMLRTPFPKWDDDRTRGVVSGFRMAEDHARPEGPRLVIRDSRGTLEIFQTSDSIWWTRESHEEREPDGPVGLPDEKEAMTRAQDFLHERGLAHELARVKSVTYTMHSRIGEGGKVLADYPIEEHVNFDYAFEGVPILGPGAKARVTFGAGHEVIEAYRFWREPVRDRSMRLIGPEKAIAQIRGDRAFAQLHAKRAKISIQSITLGYYALPPRRRQLFLIPVYAFEGVASTEVHERYEFVKHVVAVQISRDEAKCIGTPRYLAPPAIF